MNPTESQTNNPSPVSAVRFRPEPPSQNAEDRENREKWEVGAPYIINDAEAPAWNQIVICTHPDGRCRYLVIRHNHRWPHVMNLSAKSIPLAAFGVVFWLACGSIEGQQTHPSTARYKDGKPRPWQAPKADTMPLMAPSPKHWRLDPQVTPKFIAWIEGNLPSMQLAKGTPEPPLTMTSLQIMHDHDTAWRNTLILPLVRFMQQREMKVISITVDAGIAGFELTPKGEAMLVYELVDATDEERYYPMGLFLNLATAMREAPAHHPGKWEPIMDTAAVAEIRARKVGTSGGDYAVLWRGHWHHDYEAGDWKLAEQQTGTLKKPLPITRA